MKYSQILSKKTKIVTKFSQSDMFSSDILPGFAEVLC